MTRQRPGALKFNPRHPLALGLLAAFPGSFPFTNQVSGKIYGSTGNYEPDELFTQHWRTGGAGTDFVEIDRFGLTAYTHKFTFALWLKASLSTAGTYDRYIGPIGVTNDFGATIQVDNFDQLGAAVNKQGVADVTATRAGAITIGRWYHAVGTFNGSAVGLYVDGQFVTSSNYDGNITSTGSTGTGWVFGGEKFNGSMANTAGGSIGHALIYNRILSAVEIWQLWADPWAMYRPTVTRRAFPFVRASRRIFIVS